jgi:hypothetical protein
VAQFGDKDKTESFEQAQILLGGIPIIKAQMV